MAAYHFHRVTLFGIPANLLAMPLMSFWIMPWAVLGLVLMPLGLEALALVPMGWGIEALLRVAADVTALPGAVQLVPQIPFASFLLLTAGWLWLVLVRVPGWRRYAALPLLLTILPALMSSRPDVLVGREGAIFAVLDDNGDYAISTNRAGRFTRKVWLETHGQDEYSTWPRGSDWGGGRKIAGGSSSDSYLRCDPVACIYKSPSAPDSEVTFVAKREGFAEACQTADVVISAHFAPRDCLDSQRNPGQVIDGRLMRRVGAMSMSLVDGRWEVESVADARGARPWTGPEKD